MLILGIVSNMIWSVWRQSNRSRGIRVIVSGRRMVVMVRWRCRSGGIGIIISRSERWIIHVIGRMVVMELWRWRLGNVSIVSRFEGWISYVFGRMFVMKLWRRRFGNNSIVP